VRTLACVRVRGKGWPSTSLQGTRLRRLAISSFAKSHLFTESKFHNGASRLSRVPWSEVEGHPFPVRMCVRACVSFFSFFLFLSLSLSLSLSDILSLFLPFTRYLFFSLSLSFCLCISVSLCLCVSISLYLCVSMSLCPCVSFLCVSVSLCLCVPLSLCISVSSQVVSQLQVHAQSGHDCKENSFMTYFIEFYSRT